MNNFLSGMIFCCKKGPFPAETAVQSRRLPVLKCSLISEAIVHLNKTQRRFFANNDCVPEL